MELKLRGGREKMNIDKYFEELNKRLEAMSDEEFKELLIKSGIENCPLLDDKIENEEEK